MKKFSRVSPILGAFLAVVAHHGRPVDINKLTPDDYRHLWVRREDCDPVADLAALGAAVPAAAVG